MERGVYTAIVTPFTDDNQVDFKGFEKLLELQIAAGVKGVVPLGTTGENPVIDEEERLNIIKFAVNVCKGKIHVCAGTGTNNTAQSIKYSKMAFDAGADSLLVVTPYYNKPCPDGLYAHYKAISDAVPLPIVFYNVPSRTGLDASLEAIVKCSSVPNVKALKAASGNLVKAADVKIHTDLSVFSGDDGITLPVISVGGDGVISVISNIFPREMVEMVKLALDGNYGKALEIHQKLLDMMQKLFIHVNPVPVKWALYKMGLIKPYTRLPLIEMPEEKKAVFETALKKFL